MITARLLARFILLAITLPGVVLGAETRRNNLVADLFEATSIPTPTRDYSFGRRHEGWIFVAADCQSGTSVRVFLDDSPTPLIERKAAVAGSLEAMRYVAGGDHKLRVECQAGGVSKLFVRAIPELLHCGLGYNPAIKGFGLYDLAFLQNDVLPNITGLVVPANLKLTQSELDSWHKQGKRFIGEVGINGQAKTADEHLHYWTGVLDKAPFLDGVIINEFIVNAPSARVGVPIRPERQQRIEQERQKYLLYGEAIRKLRASPAYKNKMLYGYVGGSGKTLNQEIIGPDFIKTIVDCNYRVALERYLHERSSEQGSKEALRTFVDGISDWEAKQPGVKNKMVIAFGLFSMPPGGINKQPNVDYHVWMDQQMNVVANDPALAGIGGLEWWTSLLADEETVRFVGKLYRHYAIEGRTEMLTRDPLFLTHIQNADFEHGTENWALRPADQGTIEARSFPRYGRIEGRYMGLGRPADPEHIGDTFLWMKRNAKGPNSFAQTIRGLQPGTLYSLKMFTCDYQDLVHAKRKTSDEAQKFLGKIALSNVDVDRKRSFSEMYASNPEPPVPVWITYHWMVFRAKGATATLTVSDWPDDQKSVAPFGQEQTFNFVEIQPYHD